MNYILDNNIIIDLLSKRRRNKYPESIKAYEYLKNNEQLFISSSSIDNIEFILFKELKAQFEYSNKEALEQTHKLMKEFFKDKKIAKTPSYLEIDYDDIEDSQVIASAQAIDAKVITRDIKMLEKYTDTTISPTDYLKTKNQKTKTKIDFANLKKQHFMYEAELSKAMDDVLNNSSFIMGDAVKTLEKNLQEFTGAKHAITCSSGTDALLLAMMALDIQPGDEIITTPFTFIATAETIAFLKAKPVFVDIDKKTYNIDPSKIEAAITPKTKAIMPVSLYGQPADMDAIQKIIDKTLKTKNQKLVTIIDGAQSFGSTYRGKSEVHYCDIYTTSFFPAKPLGCYGDGGAVFTNNQKLATKIQSLRVHGQSKRYHHQYIGMGGRMDTLQCAVVDVKLKYYKKDLALRQEVAKKYTKALENNLGSKTLVLPYVDKNTTSAWAQYSIRVQSTTKNQKLETRNQLQTKLKEAGIPTAVHYPMPLHLQECFAYLGYKKGDFTISEIVSSEIMSLPMNPYVSDGEINYISEILL